MKVGKAIYSILSGHAGTTAITTNIYQALMIQGDDVPAVVYRAISSMPQNSQSGFNAVRSVYQVDIIATSYDSVQALAEQVILALADKAAGTYGGVAVQTIKLEDVNDTTIDAGEDMIYTMALDFSIYWIN